MKIILAVILTILSGFIGFYLDTVVHLDSSHLFWGLGMWTGICVGFLIKE